MSQAAYEKKVKVEGESSGTFHEIPFTNANLNQGGVILDDTDLAQDSDFRTRTYGLRDWSISGSANWKASDSALTRLRNAWLNQTVVTVQYLPDGSTGNGFEGDAVVESFNLSGDIEGLELVEISLQADGALGAAS
jgi:predicted secreted protein